jgi:AcrR family transcriptional regulator
VDKQDVPTRGKKKAGAPRKKAERTAGKVTRAIGRPTGKRRIGKELLIEQTAELLRTLPPEKLSLSVAARHARVHLTLFKYYFQDRTRLLVDVARMLSKEFGDSVAAVESDATSAPDRLAIRIDAMVDFLMANPFYHRLMVEIIGDETDPWRPSSSMSGCRKRWKSTARSSPPAWRKERCGRSIPISPSSPSWGFAKNTCRHQAL